MIRPAAVFSREADAGLREEKASKQKNGASVLIQSESILLQGQPTCEFWE
jgi:hypothetical protein